MSGRNWMQRRISIEAIRNDPEWNGGNYAKNPSRYVLTAPFSALLTQSVVRLQELAPTRAAGDAEYRKLVERARQGDANDGCIRSRRRWITTLGGSEKIGRVLAINFEDGGWIAAARRDGAGLARIERALRADPGGRNPTATTPTSTPRCGAARWPPQRAVTHSLPLLSAARTHIRLMAVVRMPG
jgi:hypothetical protein